MFDLVPVRMQHVDRLLYDRRIGMSYGIGIYDEDPHGQKNTI